MSSSMRLLPVAHVRHEVIGRCGGIVETDKDMVRRERTNEYQLGGS